METPGNLRPDAFTGAADDYLRFRPAYPPTLLTALVAEVSPPRHTLLDLACGPGRIALDLAPMFDSVIAADLDPGMIATGAAEARRRAITNIRWITTAAESLTLPASSLDLITIGEAFHRLDQPRIAALAMKWLRSGGVVANMGTRGLLSGHEPWQSAIAEITHRWASLVLPGGIALGRSGVALTQQDQAQVIAGAGFTGLADHQVETPRAWSFEEILGYLRSTSVASVHALGDHWPAFEADLRAALGDGPFDEAFQAGYSVARKP